MWSSSYIRDTKNTKEVWVFITALRSKIGTNEFFVSSLILHCKIQTADICVRVAYLTFNDETQMVKFEKALLRDNCMIKAKFFIFYLQQGMLHPP